MKVARVFPRRTNGGIRKMSSIKSCHNCIHCFMSFSPGKPLCCGMNNGRELEKITKKLRQFEDIPVNGKTDFCEKHKYSPNMEFQ